MGHFAQLFQPQRFFHYLIILVKMVFIAGQMIGKIGETMAETGAETHLHLEVLKGGNYVDPEHYFQ